MLCVSTLALASTVVAQQFAGDVIPNSLPNVPGSKIVYYRIKDPAGKNNNLTLTNYYSLQANGAALVPSQVQRAVIVIHGLDRDPGTYMSNMLSALSQTTGDKNVNFSSVAIMAPYFPNGDDKNIGYPWTSGLSAGKGSTTNALVWLGSQWSAGGNNQYPYTSTTVSSYTVLDQLTAYFDDKTNFPNLKQIVVAGHSLGGQTVQRYSEVSTTTFGTPVTYWIGNPDSYAWLSTDRPLPTSSCAIYDSWREGFSNYTQYPMTYGTSLVASGRSQILANYNTKNKNYARGTQDLGNDASTCAAGTTGANRNERFFNFIAAFPPSCSYPGHCDTIDYVNAGHDAGAMFSSAAGQARLFTDNFYGDGSKAYDFGYPRLAAGDDPFPNPALNASVSANQTAYAGNLTFQGCYTDSSTNKALPFQAYDQTNNTIELCTSTCVALGYTIAGAEYGLQCFCGNALTGSATQTSSQGCTQPCAGNSSETCGASARLSIYSNGTPAQLALPGTPETIGNYNSYQCYTEASNGVRALSAKGYSDNKNMTLESCASFCNGYQYFGVEYAAECYCGSYFNAGAGIASGSDCSMTCSGNAVELCGGPNRLTTYQLSSGASVSVISQPASSSTTSSSSATVASTGTVTGSTTSTSSAAASSSSFCPAADGQVITDSNGVGYTIHCASDSTQGSYTGVQASSSYLDCLIACDAASANKCIGFTYVGGANGVGGGTCYLKTGMGSYTVTGSNFISGVQSGGGASSSSSVSSSSSSSVSSSASSTSGSTLTGSSSTGSSLMSASSGTSTDSSSTSATSGTSTDSSSTSASSGSSSSNSGLSTTSSGSTPSTTLSGTTLSSTSSGSTSAPATLTTTTSQSTSRSSTSSSSSTASATPSAVSCPASNNTVYTATNGAIFLIECGIDHSAGDMGSTYVTSFAGCIQACANTAGCVDVSLSGSACYLKSKLGAAINNGGILGAKLVTSTSTTSSSAVSTSSSSTAASSSSTTAVSSSTSTSASSSSSSPASTSSSSSSSSSAASSTSSSSSTAPITTTSSSSSSSSVASSIQSTTSPSSTASPTSTSVSSTLSTVVSSSSSTSSTLATVTSTSTSASSSSSTTSSTTTASNSLISPLPSGFSSLGCFVDGSTRALPHENGTLAGNTPSQCALNCRGAGYKYSGTEYGTECWCGNTAPATTAVASTCSMSCPGDNKQTCGGSNRLSVVLDNTYTQTFFVRQSYSTWNLLACYTDGSTRTLPKGLSTVGGGSNMTVSNCLDACAAAGLPYCGAEYYAECYGSASAPSTSLVAAGADPISAGCSFACKGNTTESCGGSNRILVYVNNGTASN